MGRHSPLWKASLLIALFVAVPTAAQAESGNAEDGSGNGASQDVGTPCTLVIASPNAPFVLVQWACLSEIGGDPAPSPWP